MKHETMLCVVGNYVPAYLSCSGKMSSSRDNCTTSSRRSIKSFAMKSSVRTVLVLHRRKYSLCKNALATCVKAIFVLTTRLRFEVLVRRKVFGFKFF